MTRSDRYYVWVCVTAIVAGVFMTVRGTFGSSGDSPPPRPVSPGYATPPFSISPGPSPPLQRARISDDFDCTDLFADGSAAEISKIFNVKAKRQDDTTFGTSLCSFELDDPPGRDPGRNAFGGALHNYGSMLVLDGHNDHSNAPPSFDAPDGNSTRTDVEGHPAVEVEIPGSEDSERRCQYYVHFARGGQPYTVFTQVVLHGFEIDVCKATRDTSKVWLERVADS